LDYLTIKPFSQQEKSINREYENISYQKYSYLNKELEKLNDNKFQVIYREKAIKKQGKGHNYSVCHAVPFLWAHITARGDVYSCGNFVGDQRFKLGNYNEKTFKEIWEGNKRKNHWNFIKTKFDTSRCRENCRMDEINRYLEKLNNPPEHINFI
jgi:GTP 3',8-cyclase